MKHLAPFRSRLLILFGILLLLSFGLVTTVSAFEFPESKTVGPDEVINDDVYLSSDTIIVDGTVNGILFANASNFTLNGSVNGDLITNAAMVEINGTVNGNLVAAGQIVKVNGTVTGSVFSASAALTLDRNAEIGRNLYAMGYSLEIRNGSSVGMDAALTGYQALIHGSISRDINASVVAFLLDGEIGRDIKLDVEPPEAKEDFVPPPYYFFLETPGIPSPIPAGLQILPDAKIGGHLHYVSPVEQTEGIQSTPAGGVEYSVRIDKSSQVNTKATFFQSRLHHFIVLVVLGLLVLRFLPSHLTRCVQQTTPPWRALGWGILVTLLGYFLLGSLLILVIVVAILLGIVRLDGLASLVGSTGVPGMVLSLTLFSVLVSHGSKLVVAALLGGWVFQRIRPGYNGHPFWPLFVGILIYILLSAIPFPPIYLLVGFLATTIGIGAMWLALRQKPSPPIENDLA